jgi:phosphonate transport system substrate-binding protein
VLYPKHKPVKRAFFRIRPWLRVRTAAVLVAIFVFVLASQSLDGAGRPLTLGVVTDVATLQEREPLRAYLTKAMGRPVVIAAPDTFSETVTHLGDGSYDFACLGALMYIRAHAKYGVIPLVQRVVDLHYRTVFITAAGSSIRSLSDLAGKQFVFGDIDSTSAHLMAVYELKGAGINPETDLHARYSGSHRRPQPWWRPGWWTPERSTRLSSIS